MQWLRTIRRFVRVLAALFVIAQLAGVVPSPLASVASGDVATADMHHNHADTAGAIFHSHNGRAKNHVDPCCGLHAFFAGVLPAPIILDPVNAPHQQLSAALDDMVVQVNASRLDRPPRPSAVI